MEAFELDFVPYHRSALWQLQDAYYLQRGAAAWTAGEIPYFGLNNPVVAGQVGRLLCGLVNDLEGSDALLSDEPIGVLELGAGLGDFAVHLFEALRSRCGRAGRRIAARLRYIMTDFARGTLEQVARRSELAPLVSSGHVVPAILDLRDPQRPVTLDGVVVDLLPSAVIANYVACVSPVRVVQKRKEAYFEKYVSLQVEEAGSRDANQSQREQFQGLLNQAAEVELIDRFSLRSEWRPIESGELGVEPWSERTLRDVTARLVNATLAYPEPFLRCLRRLERWIKPGGIAIVNDYGSSDRAELGVLTDVEPQHYGNTLAHDLTFSIFEAFATALNLSCLRTTTPLRSIQTAVIVYSESVSPTLRKAFSKSHVQSEAVEDMIDFTAAAGALFDQGEAALAARLYRRCLRHAPEDAELNYRFAECCVALKEWRLAIRFLRKGKTLDAAHEYDFTTLLRKAVQGLRGARRATLTAPSTAPSVTDRRTST